MTIEKEECKSPDHPNKCVRCDTSIEHDGLETPYDAISLVATGNYGSRIWDPLYDDKRFVCWLCDECFVKMVKDRTGHLYFERIRPTKIRTPILDSEIQDIVKNGPYGRD